MLASLEDLLFHRAQLLSGEGYYAVLDALQEQFLGKEELLSMIGRELEVSDDFRNTLLLLREHILGVIKAEIAA